MTVSLLSLVLLVSSSAISAQTAGSRAGDRTRLLIGYKPDALGKSLPLEQALGLRLVRAVDQIDVHIVAVAADRALAVANLLRRDPRVRFVNLDSRIYASRTPNDEFWTSQWSPIKTEAPQAWDLSTGSPQVVVAVLDTGIDAGQPDLAGRVLPGYDFVNNGTAAKDDNGHGTAVAGIVAAVGNNRIGVAGYCWQCRILPVKVLGADGSGLSSDVASGIVWAADHGARVINTSLGGPADDLAVAAAAQYATAQGALVVAAAGNDSSSTLEYPAALPGVVSVSASDENDQLYSFSNTGATLAAPGNNLSTGNGGEYVTFLGTSSAAPVVSGIAGLAFSVAPTAAPAEVSRALEQSAATIAGVAYGRVNAYATLHLLAPALSPSPTPAPGRDHDTQKAVDAAAGSHDGRRSIVLAGRLCGSQHRRVSYVRPASGTLLATLNVPARVRQAVELRLLAPDGSIVARGRRGQAGQSLRTKVDPLTYRLVLLCGQSKRPFSFTLQMTFPTPESG